MGKNNFTAWCYCSLAAKWFCVGCCRQHFSLTWVLLSGKTESSYQIWTSSLQAGLSCTLSCWAALLGLFHLLASKCNSLIFMTSFLKLLRILPNKYLNFLLIPLGLFSYFTKVYNLLFFPFLAMQISEMNTPFPVILYIWASNKFLWRLCIKHFVVLNFDMLHS